MKRIIVTGLFVSLAAGVYAQKQAATISGITTRYEKEPVRLFNITHGRLQEIASSKPSENGSFGFLFYPEPGFYVVGNGTEMIPTYDKYTFYLEPGDALNLEINDTSYRLTGKNTKENLAMEKWHDAVLSLERKSFYFMKNRSNYEDFFPDMERMLPGLRAFKAPATGNNTFDRLFAEQRAVDLLSVALEFLSTPREKHPKPAGYISFYKNISLPAFTTDTRLFRSRTGARTLTNLQRFPFMLEEKKINWSNVEERMEGILNDTLKGEMVLVNAGSLKTYIGYLDLEKNFGKYILTDDQKARFSDIKTRLAKEDAQPGTAAIDFRYPDMNGKMTALSDFKGKVVLVDVWATWCGPCKAEIPALKKLEEEMRNEDVVFMSVSVDEEKDKQKWKDFVVNESLKGVQLFASGWSDIAKNYDIKGIPRFMVFDKKGNIVSVNAPRPSGSELKLLLRSELKK